MSTRDMEVFCWLLGASDEQKDEFAQLFERHADQQAATRIELVRPLREKSADIYASYSPGSLQASLELQILIRKDRAHMARQLDQLDQQLFSAMVPHLSEEQLVGLELVRGLRRRAHMANESARYPGGNLDIVLLLHLILEQQGWPTISDQHQFDEFLTSYNSEAAAAFRDREQALLKCRTDGSVLQKKQVNGLVNRDWAIEQLRSFRGELVRAEERIHDLNVRYLELFAGVIKGQAASLLETSWRELVYEPVYPDPTDTTSIFDAALRLDSLPPETMEQVDALRVAIESDHASLNETMVRRFLEYRTEHGIEWRFGDIYDRYEADLLRLHDQRIKLAKQEIEWLRASIPADAWSLIESQAGSILAHIERFELVPDRRRGFDPGAH